ncbi:MAG: sigma-70 family RNA polymerase sigma factor [Ignavibacteriae bacterium]|nr:MAG: sigma-70 family RNA polymerase sigma factor [Ignavibacteriota bacterium]
MYNTSRKTAFNVIEKVPLPNPTPDIEADDNIVEEQEINEQEQLQITDENYRIAFEKEALPHLNALYNFAYKMLGNKLDADDMIQETYLRAFRFFNSYEKGTNCKAWLFRIMKNVIINKYRKEQKEAANVDYDDVMNYISNIKSIQFDTDDFQQKLYSKLLDDEMTGALNSIHDDFKIVVILCDLEGLSYEEIAEFLHCPIGTVRSRLHRGRRLLQQKLFLYARQRGYNVGTAA